MRLIVPVTGLVLLLAASASGSGTGMSGRVTASPACPVQRQPADPKCAPRGFRASVRVTRSADGKVVARVLTGANGRFRIALRPGRYRVSASAANGAPLPRCPAARTVKVARSGYARASIACDSGIR
jgi:hypothetical protein